MSAHRWVVLAVTAALVAMVAGLVVALTASPAAAANLYWRHFVGGTSGRCLDVDTHSNYTVQLWNCDSGSDESWRLQYVGTAYPDTDYYQVINGRTGTCLGTTGGSLTRGAAVVVTPCAPTLTQWWYLADKTSSTPRIVNLGSGLCLDARNNATGNGTIVQQYDCNYTTAQSWTDLAA